MALYISNRQVMTGQTLSPSFVPTLLEAKYGLKHRVFSPPFKFSKLLLDSYEISNRKDREIKYPVVPTGCVTLVFMLGPHAHGEVMGCNTVLRELVVPPKMTAYCVRLRAGAFRFFSHIDVSELTDQTVPMGQWVPNLEKLCQPMRYAESFHERNIILQRFVDKLDGKCFYINEKLQKSIDFIKDREGILKIQSLADEVECTTRYLSRIFLQHVGVATKMYCQIYQLNASLQSILETRPKSLLDTSITYGYVDQTHMNRVYRKFLFCTAYELKNYGLKDMSRIERLMDPDPSMLELKPPYFLRATTL